MWLIAGLGNPGSKYLLTRHNVGFMALDYLAKSLGLESAPAKVEHKAMTTHFKWDGTPCVAVKPQTFMNLSGDAIVEIKNYYKIEVAQIIVVHDELDLPFGTVRIKLKGGEGGHNGIRSTHEQLGSDEYVRVRIGVGRPPVPGPGAADYVLQNFSKDEQAALPDVLNTAVDAIEAIVFDGALVAMNKFNGRNGT